MTSSGPGPQYLVLPGDGDTPCHKLVVEVIVGGVNVDAFHRGELLDVQHVFAVHGPRLSENTDQGVSTQLKGEQPQNIKLE